MLERAGKTGAYRISVIILLTQPNETELIWPRTPSTEWPWTKPTALLAMFNTPQLKDVAQEVEDAIVRECLQTPEAGEETVKRERL